VGRSEEVESLADLLADLDLAGVFAKLGEELGDLVGVHAGRWHLDRA